jgi:4-hydroxybenzoate polyprenyltransferase
MTTAHPALPATSRLRTYASFVRFEHTLFSLPLILAGVFSANGRALEWSRWALIAVAAVGARTAAMSLNRLIDRRLDARNPRTAQRELPAGRMKLTEAVALLLVSTAVYLVACAALGPWYVTVAVIPFAVFALYPYLKRFTPLCHAGVGTALALAPLAGFAAGHPQLEDSLPAWGLAAFAFLWVTGFDIIYATLDEAFDRGAGVHSMVVWLGRARALRVSWALHVGAMVALGWALWRLAFNLDRVGDRYIIYIMAPPSGWANPFWLSVTAIFFLATVVLLWLEQRWAENVNLAFFKTNVAVGFLVLLAVLVARITGGGF